MSTGVNSMGGLDNPRLDLAKETLNKIRECELRFKQEEKDPDKLLLRLEDLWVHKDFIIGWAHRDMIGTAIKEHLLTSVTHVARLLEKGVVKSIKKDHIADIKMRKIEAMFQTISSLAHSAAHSVNHQIQANKKIRKDIENKIEELKEELACLLFIESNVQ